MRLDMSVFDIFEAILICPWYWSNRPEPISRERSALVKLVTQGHNLSSSFMTQEQDFHCVADQLQLLMYPQNVRGQTRKCYPILLHPQPESFVYLAYG